MNESGRSPSDVPCVSCGRWRDPSLMHVAVSPRGKAMSGLWVCKDDDPTCWESIVAAPARVLPSDVAP